MLIVSRLESMGYPDSLAEVIAQQFPRLANAILTSTDRPVFAELEDSCDSIDHYLADRADEYIDGWMIDNRSPRPIVVYRGLANVGAEEFDPNYNLKAGASDCVSDAPGTPLAFAKDGVMVQYRLPALLLDYNRGDYIIDARKLLDLGVDDLSAFVTAVGRVLDPNTAVYPSNVASTDAIDWVSPPVASPLP